MLEPRITPFPLGGGLVSYVDTHGQPPNNGGQDALAFEVRGIEDAAKRVPTRARGSPNAGKPFVPIGLLMAKPCPGREQSGDASRTRTFLVDQRISAICIAA
jgi:hypothetical protein